MIGGRSQAIDSHLWIILPNSITWQSFFFSFLRSGGGTHGPRSSSVSFAAPAVHQRCHRKFMKKKTIYTDEPIGKVKVEELALKDETVKVTIALSKTSVEFFKKEAEKYNTQYQKMIRRLLDEYAAHQS